MATSPPRTSIGTVRDFFSRNNKEKLSPALKRALSLLELEDLDALEECFLGCTAFFKPWAVFRDVMQVEHPNALQRATLLRTAGAKDGISRLELLWFYTQFDENVRRYDPRTAKPSRIDKSNWQVQDYEKHLYAWLLQEFKVGKAYNKWGFEYLELKNICVAWEVVFVPIIDAVRASYSVKGRQHFGRLALFIESKCPSRLAFPEVNVGPSERGIMSPTPFRILSMRKKMVDDNGTTFYQPANEHGVLTKKHYDETEKELRSVYPQYGGLVERPNFKHKMEEWLAVQRARAERRKVAERLDGGASSIRRYSDSIRRSLSQMSTPMKAPKEESKSPVHGVTQQIYAPGEVSDYPSSPAPKPMHQPTHHPRKESLTSFSIDKSIHPAFRPGPSQRKSSDQSVYSKIRKSNPWIDDFPGEPKSQRAYAMTNDPMFSPMGQLSAVPRPLEYETEHGRAEPVPEEIPSDHPTKSYAHARVPSYEGTGHADKISMGDLDASPQNADHKPQPTPRAKRPTRLPAPIKPVPYGGHTRLASTGAYGNEIPEHVPWPGFEPGAELTPPLPPKSPERWNSTRGHVSGPRPQQLMREETQDLSRIVSKENIRAALGGISRENSVEDLASEAPPMPTATMSRGGKKPGLQTYNRHLFPRNSMPPRNRAENKQRCEVGGEYEMEVLGSESKKDEKA